MDSYLYPEQTLCQRIMSAQQIEDELIEEIKKLNTREQKEELKRLRREVRE